METERLVVTIVLLALGAVFFFNSKNIGKGAFKFYQKVYTEKNLAVMFKILGIILVILAGLVVFIK